MLPQSDCKCLLKFPLYDRVSLVKLQWNEVAVLEDFHVTDLEAWNLVLSMQILLPTLLLLIVTLLLKLPLVLLLLLYYWYDNVPVRSQNSEYSTLICNFLCYLQIKKDKYHIHLFIDILWKYEFEWMTNIWCQRLSLSLTYAVNHLIWTKTLPFKTVFPESQHTVL